MNLVEFKELRKFAVLYSHDSWLKRCGPSANWFGWTSGADIYFNVFQEFLLVAINSVLKDTSVKFTLRIESKFITQLYFMYTLATQKCLSQPMLGNQTPCTLILVNFISRSLVVSTYTHTHEAQLNFYVLSRVCPNTLPRSVLFQSSLTVTCLQVNSTYSCSNIPSHLNRSGIDCIEFLDCSVKTNNYKFIQLHF